MTKKIILISALLMIIIVGCTTTDNQSNNPTTDQQNSDTSSDIPLVQTGELKEFTIIATNWEFTPSLIEVNKGDMVTLTLISNEGIHGFRLSEYNINQNMEMGKTETISFVADKSGEFPFSCSVPCGSGHRAMTGKLVVKE